MSIPRVEVGKKQNKTRRLEGFLLGMAPHEQWSGEWSIPAGAELEEDSSVAWSKWPNPRGPRQSVHGSIRHIK